MFIIFYFYQKVYYKYSNLDIIDISNDFTSNFSIVKSEIYQVGKIVYFSVCLSLYIQGSQVVKLGEFSKKSAITSLNILSSPNTGYISVVYIENGYELYIQTLQNIVADMSFSGSYLVE